jgi:hypothetical protein
VVKDDLDDASRLLDEARATCDGRSPDEIRRVSELIVDRRETKRESEALSAKRRAERDSLTQKFVDWALAPSERLTENLGAVQCVERGQPGFGFCEAPRKGAPNMVVRYWKANHETVRFSFVTNQPLECEDLGQYRRVRTWTAGQKSYELCEITLREARNLAALLLRGADENQMFIYSEDYLSRDPEFERLLRTR